MKKEILEIRHFEEIYNIVKTFNYNISEYSFANLFLFRKKHQYQIIYDKELFVSAIGYRGNKYLMPIFNVLNKNTNNEFIDYLSYMIREFGELFPIPESSLGVFDPSKFSYTYNVDDSDYIFTHEKMEFYRGRNLHGKRNLLKQFLQLYTPETHSIGPTRIADALNILETWIEDIGEQKDNTDYHSCYEALHMLKELKLCACICYVNAEPAGFIIGEEINPETFALHFAKGKRKFKGIYQFMYNNFAKILPKSYKYLNLEQDIGNLAMRIAKESYEPDLMVHKYSIKLA